MRRQVTATELKTKLLSLLDDVENGEEIEVTRHGRTIARISPAREPRPLAGWLTGVASTVGPEEGLYSTGETWEVMDDDDPA